MVLIVVPVSFHIGDAFIQLLDIKLEGIPLGLSVQLRLLALISSWRAMISSNDCLKGQVVGLT